MPSTITKLKGSYFHDLEPYELHPTKQGAIKARKTVDDLKLKTPLFKIKSRSPRVTTFYTFMQDPRKNNPTKFGEVPQGPHIFPHAVIHRALIEARAQDKLDAIMKLLPDTTDFDKAVDTEIPTGHAKYARAQVAKAKYKKVYNKFLNIKYKPGETRETSRDIKLAHTINRLLQMDPHGTYAYKGKGAGKKALSGKNEANKPFAKQIDLPSNAKFGDLNAVKARNKALLDVVTHTLKMK